MNTKGISEFSIKKYFLQYTFLGILSMIGTSLFILADTFFIATGIGPDGIAALNIVLPMVNIFNGLGWMLGVGGATLFSMAKARSSLKEGQEVFTVTTVLAAIIAILFTFIALYFSEPILVFLGARGHIYSLSQSYYSVIIRFSPLFILNNMMITFLRNDGNPKLAMIALVSGGLVNILLDYLFIFPLNMGMRGAALATVTSPVFSLIISSLHLLKDKRQLSFTHFTVSFKKMIQIFSIGFASFLNEFSSAVVMFLFNIVLLRLVGNVGVAAYGIIANMNIVVIMVFTGMGQGFQPIVSQFYGANKQHDVNVLLKYVLTTSMAISVLILGIGFFFPDTIVALFNNDQNQALAQLAVPGLILYFSSFLFTGFNFSVIYFMAAVGRSRASLILSLLRGLILIVPVLVILSNSLGVTGVWSTMTVVEFLTSMVSFYVLYIYKKSSSHYGSIERTKKQGGENEQFT